MHASLGLFTWLQCFCLSATENSPDTFISHLIHLLPRPPCCVQRKKILIHLFFTVHAIPFRHPGHNNNSYQLSTHMLRSMHLFIIVSFLSLKLFSREQWMKRMKGKKHVHTYISFFCYVSNTTSIICWHGNGRKGK